MNPPPKKNEVTFALVTVALLVGALSYQLKGCGFNSRSGHMPKLQVWFPVGECARSNQLMFSLTPVFLSFMFLGEDKKNKVTYKTKPKLFRTFTF